MARYYCPQASHPTAGWVDLPTLASLQQKEADTAAKTYAETYYKATRVIRKPHGWTPEEAQPKK